MLSYLSSIIFQMFKRPTCFSSSSSHFTSKEMSLKSFRKQFNNSSGENSNIFIQAAFHHWTHLYWYFKSRIYCNVHRHTLVNLSDTYISVAREQYITPPSFSLLENVMKVMKKPGWLSQLSLMSIWVNILLCHFKFMKYVC